MCCQRLSPAPAGPGGLLSSLPWYWKLGRWEEGTVREGAQGFASPWLSAHQVLASGTPPGWEQVTSFFDTAAGQKAPWSLHCSFTYTLPLDCEHQGRKYEPGQSFQPGADPCEVCTCEVGRVCGWTRGAGRALELGMTAHQHGLGRGRVFLAGVCV